MLEDSKVDLVEMLVWCRDSAATAPEKFIQSLACESLPFADKPTCRCRPNKEATSV